MQEQEYTEIAMQATKTYLQELKSLNRKEYNKMKKQGRKFSDTIMKRLK